jgi:secreted PhoX family phosphatase
VLPDAAAEVARADPDAPSRYSRWPDGGRPRSATVVIRKLDGGVIGT